MLIKPGVDITHLARPMRRALTAIDAIYPDFVLTSTRHDLHSAGSLHYGDLAIDIRKRVMAPGPTLSVERIREMLRTLPRGECYQVVVEGNHIHIEFDEG